MNKNLTHAASVQQDLEDLRGLDLSAEVLMGQRDLTVPQHFKKAQWCLIKDSLSPLLQQNAGKANLRHRYAAVH